MGKGSKKYQPKQDKGKYANPLIRLFSGLIALSAIVSCIAAVISIPQAQNFLFGNAPSSTVTAPSPTYTVKPNIVYPTPTTTPNLVPTLSSANTMVADQIKILPTLTLSTSVDLCPVKRAEYPEQLIIVGGLKQDNIPIQYDVMDRIYSSLNEIIRANKVADIRVVKLDKSIVENYLSDDTANTLKATCKARMVIWGYRDSTDSGQFSVSGLRFQADDSQNIKICLIKEIPGQISSFVSYSLAIDIRGRTLRKLSSSSSNANQKNILNNVVADLKSAIQIQESALPNLFLEVDNPCGRKFPANRAYQFLGDTYAYFAVLNDYVIQNATVVFSEETNKSPINDAMIDDDISASISTISSDKAPLHGDRYAAIQLLIKSESAYQSSLKYQYDWFADYGLTIVKAYLSELYRDIGQVQDAKAKCKEVLQAFDQLTLRKPVNVGKTFDDAKKYYLAFCT